MGVKDLWQLIAPIGRRISIETLEGKSLAIDMSIWLTQFIKAMRDEEGKMIKNAHLIGTLRRILKLLFHKVRPIFVFDGATPSLKAYIMQKRRRTYERHESNKKAAVHRMILNQLKKQLAEARKIKETKKEESKDDQYAAGFTAPSVKEENQNDTDEKLSTDPPKVPGQSTTRYLMEDTNDLVNDDTIEWTSGYENLKGKEFDNHDQKSDSEDGEQEFYLPEDTHELSADVLAALPLQMRKQIIEELRRKERIRSRSNYIPVAENPSLYSQTQLSNFLKTSKLNRKFDQVQKALTTKEDRDQGKQIAAEGKKRYRYIDATELYNGASKKEAWETAIVKNDEEEMEEMEEEEQAEEDESEFLNWQTNASKKRKSISFQNESEDESGQVSGRKFRRLQKGNQLKSELVVNQADLPVEEPSPGDGIAESGSLLLESKLDQDKEGEDGSYSPIGGGFLPEDGEAEEEEIIKPISESPTLSHVKTEMIKSEVEDSGFYDNIHGMDSDEDNAFDDADWEAEDKDEEVSISDIGDDVEKREEPDILTELRKLHSKSISVVVEIPETEKKVQFEPVPSISFLPNENSNLSSYSDTYEHSGFNQQSSTASASTINRAIATASGMADWAGRVVRRVLKEHLPKENPTSIQVKSEPSTNSSYPIPISSSVQADCVDLSKTETIESKLSNRSVPTPELPFLMNSKSSSGPVWNKITEQMIRSQEDAEPEDDIDAKQSLEQEEVMPGGQTKASNNTQASQYPQEDKDEFLENEWMNDEDRQFYERILQEEEATAIMTSTSPDELMDEEKLKKIIANSSRDTEKITEEMKEQVMELLHAFDLPYIIAPYEAEAQCAVLEQLGLVDGVVTEDSDSFLFGAEAVYKNIFNDKKFVEVYLAEDARRELGLKREDFIALAYFLGSDYTEGIHGIGIVNSMEIIQAFPIEANEDDGSVNSILKSLQKFKEWLQGYDFVKDIMEEMTVKESSKQISEKRKKRKNIRKKGKDSESDEIDKDEEEKSGAENETERSDIDEKNNLLIAFDKKHKNGRSKWVLPENFPDPRIAQEYYQPMTNRDNEKFLWKYPSKQRVGQYCSRVLGWTDAEIEAQITPILQKFAEKSVQTRIDQHFLTYHDNTRFAKIASERLTSAVAQITGKSSNLALFGPTKTTSLKKNSSTSSPMKKKVSKQESS